MFYAALHYDQCVRLSTCFRRLLFSKEVICDNVFTHSFTKIISPCESSVDPS